MARINVTAPVWASVRLSPACVIRKCGNDPVDDLQDGREQLGMCSEQQTKRDRKRRHPLPHRHRGMT
jgi:hypothetical protein